MPQLMNVTKDFSMNKHIKWVLKNIYRAYGRFLIVRHGFWFVDIPRTSSSSIRSELGKHFGRVYGKKNVLEKELASEQIFPDHLPARKMSAFLGNSKWNSIFTFTLVRNPWDRIYSMYNYRRRVGDELPKEWSFRDYVLALGKASSESKFFKYHGYRYGASDYVLGKNGEIIVDYIGKYENRLHDLNLIASYLGLSKLGELTIQRASPKNKHYSEYYDPETRDIIGRLYAKDIELFDYGFDDKT